MSPLQVELTTINDIYNSCKPTIISAINLLNTESLFGEHVNSNNHLKRSLLPFLGDALRWLTGTATTKDGNSIKQHVNQLTEAQSIQKETSVNIVSILNITRYAAQVNRHSIDILMDKVDETSHDVNSLYNMTTSLATSLSYHQLILYIRSVLANLWDSLWCWPARLVHQPLQPGTMQYTVVDDDVEAAPIYRCNGKALQPTRPCENHGLHIEHIWKQQTQKFLIDIYVYINIHYCMDYVHTHAQIWITQPHHTMIPWIWMTFLSFEDLMTTSSKEDIPALDEVGY